jgi:hypothetical protein
MEERVLYIVHGLAPAMLQQYDPSQHKLARVILRVSGPDHHSKYCLPARYSSTSQET